MKDRITVLMGAGAMIEYTKVSTSSLTEKILDSCRQFKACPHYKPPVESIKCNKNKCCCCSRTSIAERVRDLYRDRTGEEANFEMIFHMLEVIYNYRENCSNTENIISVLCECLSGIDFSSVYRSLYEIINVINEEIYDYDKDFSSKGTDFKKFFDKLLEKDQYCLDVFNLNYDTWVEQSIPDYIDGFVRMGDMNKEISKFDPVEYIKECDKNRISHLHGQIYFGFPGLYEKGNTPYTHSDTQDMLYKYTKYEDAKENRIHRMPGTDVIQSGGQIFYSNIITGLFKTDKVLWSPMDVYHSMLIRSLIENKRLIIIGYGFADLYINKALLLHNNVHIDDKKIVMIDMKDSNDDGNKPYTSNPFQSCGEKTPYVGRIFQNDHWFKEEKRDGRNGEFLSEGKGVCVYGNGFSKVIQESMDEVLEFLQ